MIKRSSSSRRTSRFTVPIPLAEQQVVVAERVERDPDEVTNLAGDPAHAAILRELTARLREFQRTTRDPWLHKWDRE